MGLDMPISRRQFLTLFTSSGAARPSASFDPDLHLLNRISYGARPEDLAHLRAIGASAYLEAQLDPERIDDSALEERLRQTLPILFMNRRDVYDLGFDGRVERALRDGFLLRAIHSRRQLYERMVEFWLDHFNIPAEGYAQDLIAFQRDVIRRHALGRFRDLVFGAARSPAMLYYLDNHSSSAEHPNENYARELLELHTLGVSGGYTERDVREAARALTGWCVHDGVADGFFFDRSVHDFEPKQVLGRSLPAGRGIEDGLHVLDLAVHHPSTPRFVCRKLCVRFVSDSPPDDLVESAAQVWEAHDGAIVPVLRHILTSDAFRASAGMKLRRPLEFFVAAARATGAVYRDAWHLTETLNALGQPPFGWGPPDGYPDVASAWLAAGLMLERWNTAIAMTHAAYSEQYSGIDTAIRQRVGTPNTVGELIDRVAEQVFGTPLPADLRAPFLTFMEAPADTPITPLLMADKFGMLYGLMLASPYFQWH